MATYSNTNESIVGISYLSGGIMPWEDYYIFRQDDDTSMAVYGFCDSEGHFDSATVRTVERTQLSGYNYEYTTTEEIVEDVTVNIRYPYNAYGNLIGNHYNLPSSLSVIAISVSAFCVISALVLIFKAVYRLRGVNR